jgi:hypothetical protein
MPKILTDEQKQKRNQRRQKQRQRAAQRAAEPVFYHPRILDGSGTQPCSVCSCPTHNHVAHFAHIALCSGNCLNLYADQWRQFDIDPTKGSGIIYKGRLYKFDTNIMVKNSNEEVCITAWDPQRGYSDSNVPIPLSKKGQIVQIVR